LQDPTTKRRIIGIDPGSRFTGFGIIEKSGNKLALLHAGRIAVPKGELHARLYLIFQGLSDIIAQHRPTEAAVEGLFHHRNADSALKLGQARGAALVACAHHHLSVAEYAPTHVKQAVVGTGRADKDQVQKMVKLILSMDATALALDASDALALAICHAQHHQGIDALRRRTP